MIVFEGSYIQREIVPALGHLVQRGRVRIVDLLLVRRDLDGNIVAIELDDASPEVSMLLSPLTPKTDDVHRQISGEDLADMARGVRTGSAAAIIIFEQIWMSGIRDGVRTPGRDVSGIDIRSRVRAHALHGTRRQIHKGVTAAHR